MTRAALTLIGCFLAVGCLDPVRTPPVGGGGPGAGPGDDGSGKFDRPDVSEERCGDGLDNDGNGVAEEGCPCNAGDELDCYLGPPETREVGECMSGVMVCGGDESTEFGEWGFCSGSVGPSVERCNGLDDDCDGLTDEDGVCGEEPEDCQCAQGQTCVEGVCVGSGQLRFTLVWDRPGDMDLHVATPLGNEIYFGSLAADGGELDHDDTIDTGPENIFWENAPPRGHYYVCAVPFRVDGPTGWTLTIDQDGRVSEETGTANTIDDAWSAHCEAGSPFVISEIDVR